MITIYKHINCAANKSVQFLNSMHIECMKYKRNIMQLIYVFYLTFLVGIYIFQAKTVKKRTTTV